MDNLIFISHASNDKYIVEILSHLIEKISLGQITVWFSSDDSYRGGIGAGEQWFNTVESKLRNAKTVIPFITPESLNHPWLYFESGYGAGFSDLEIIPVCVGVDMDIVPAPLKLYQVYRLSDYDSARRFFVKLFSKLSIVFDEDMCKKHIKKSISDIYKLMQKNAYDVKNSNENIYKTIDDLKMHIDRNFSKIYALYRQNQDTADSSISYSIEFNFKTKSGTVMDFIEVNSDTTVGDVLNAVYFKIEASVDPYSYLIDWILIEKNTLRKLVINELIFSIPAQYIFTMESKWNVVFLDTPYIATD